MTKAQGSAAPAQQFLFIDYLRALAAWAVVWDHVVAAWPAERGIELGVTRAVRSYVTVPLGIIQDFGWLAVAVFFLISGFVITHVSFGENVGEFVLKRVFRIYPLVIVAVILAVMFNPGLRAGLGLADLLRNMALVNYFVLPQVITVGVAWTLAVEISFYALTAATICMRRPRLALVLNLGATVAVVTLARRFGSDFFLFAATVAYVPFLLTGQIYYLWAERHSLRNWEAAVALVGCYAAILFSLFSIHTEFLPATNSYLISFVYACAIFCVLHRSSRLLPSLAVIRFLSATSFSVYIAHSVLGRPAFDAAAGQWGVPSGVAAAVGITLLGATALHFTVERPFQRFGRRLVRRFGPGV